MGIEIFRRLPGHDPSSVAEARVALSPLERAVDPNTFETLRLLVSEVVTSSVRGGPEARGDEIELSVRASRELIRVEVSGAGPGLEEPHGEDGGEGPARLGLRIVETLSDRWGSEGDGGRRVWFELLDSGAFSSRPVAGTALGGHR